MVGLKSAVALCVLLSTMICAAQNAYRCEENGATVYSDKPCVNGKPIAPTQESDAQKARSDAAAKQLKEDNKAVDARIDKRAAGEAKRREAEQKRIEKRAQRAAASGKQAKKSPKPKAVAKSAKPKKPNAAKSKPVKSGLPG